MPKIFLHACANKHRILNKLGKFIDNLPSMRNMQKINLKKLFLIAGSALLPITIVEGIFIGTNTFNFSRANAGDCQSVLNLNDQPTINNGKGTYLDSKRVTWEYENVANNASGHITLHHQGYFGVSESTQWGYTAISSIIVTFSKGTNAELWLLSSYDGSENSWNELGMLTSGEATELANNWRYIRFYNYDPDEGDINITNVTINYGCAGSTSTDDIDAVRYTNVKACTHYDYEEEEEYFSPRGNSHEALRFTNTNGETAINHTIDIKLNREYKIGEIKTRKLELDYYHKFKRKTGDGYPKIQLYNSKKNKNVGSAIGSFGNRGNAMATNINSYWWHLEYFLTSTVSTIADYGDIPIDEETVIDMVRISDGNIQDFDTTTAFVIIDNLRFGSTPSSRLGIWNGTTSFTKGEKPYWFKICWSGTLHSCDITFDDDDIAERAPSDKSPFYIRGKNAGTVTATATLVVGYNRQKLTISNKLTVK